MSAVATDRVLPRVAGVANWRYASIVLGAAIGFCFSFPVVFNAALPFFMLPLSQDFGWGRGDLSAATALAMFGVTVASPLAGRLFDRFGTERVITTSVVLFAAALYAMSLLSASLIAMGVLCFLVGVAGVGTTTIGYSGVLPSWFDRRLGLALGLSGLGAAVGIVMIPFVANRLIGAFGWRGAFVALSGLALTGGLLACLLLRHRRGEVPPLIERNRSARSTQVSGLPGRSLAEALREPRFWLLFGVTFIVPFSILGIALHGVALFVDRGLSSGQGATGAALAGIGAIASRLATGAMIDRWHAPRVACAIIIAGAVGLALNSWATSFPVLCIGVFLGGAAMGAEGDLLPYLVRRYYGLRSFGSVFGATYAAYAFGGVLGPIVYGYTYDWLHTYRPTMLACSALCTIGAVAILWLGPYRYRASEESA